MTAILVLPQSARGRPNEHRALPVGILGSTPQTMHGPDMFLYRHAAFCDSEEMTMENDSGLIPC